MLALNTEPVIEGFGDEVVLVLVATLGYVIFICYQVYLSLLPEAVEELLRGLVDPTANTVTPVAPSVEPKPEPDQGEVEQSPEAEPAPEDLLEVPVRLKYLDDATRTVMCPLSTKVGVFKSRHFSQELQEGKVVRLICYGKLLKNDNQTLKQCGISSENNIIHVQVSVPPAAPPETTFRETAPPPVSRFEANIASLAYLVLGGMLALFWEEMIEYLLVYTLAL